MCTCSIPQSRKSPLSTTVAVFRRVAALLLGVMLCAPDVVTLRHHLPDRGLLPGSGYGEEPGAGVVPAGDGLVPVPCQNSRMGSELVFSVPVRLLSGTR